MEGCNCMKEVADKCKEHMSQKEINTSGFKICESDWENKTWFPVNRLYANFIIKSTFTKKNGSESIPKSSHVTVLFSYCPFCGKPYPKKEN